MFTGIIREVGVIVQCTATSSGVRFRIRAAQIMRRLHAGSSIAISGVCLTVESKGRSWIAATAVPQTLRMTTLGRLQVGDRVNLEPSLRVGDELGGHFVYGHVGGRGRVINLKSQISNVKNKEVLLQVWIPKPLRRYTVSKGSIAVDGVSLTIARKLRDGVEVALVPFTLLHTTLGQLKVGDYVNIEVDRLLMSSRGPQSGPWRSPNSQ